MVEVHALDAWLASDVPRSALHAALSLLGGLAAPGFLYMAGLSHALAGRALEARGGGAAARLHAGLRRAGYVLVAAYAFRLFEYVAGGAWLVEGGWRDLFRVDILNVIAAGLLLAAAVGALPARGRPGVYAALAAAVALATPPVAAWPGGPGWLAPWSFARAPGANFALFPWTAFLLAGGAVGELLAAGDRPRRTLALAAALLAAGAAGAALPPVYAHQDFWHASPAWFALRLGLVVATSGLLQLVPDAVTRPLGPLRTLGRHSLLAYVASVELTYGLLARPLQKALSTVGLLGAIAALSLLIWAVAALADRRAARRKAAGPAEPPAPRPG
jgi:hypothetical protein